MTDTDYSVRTAIKEDCETVEPARTKERPILFSGQMVRAILEGRKNQTRRVVKPQPPAECSIHYPLGNESWKDEFDRTPLRHSWEAWGGALYDARPDGHLCGHHEVKCPYGVPGDRLWVRETFTADFEWPTDDGFEVRRWEQMPAAFRSEKAAASVYYFADRVKCHPRLGSDLEVVPREQQPRDDEWEAMRGRPSIHMPRWASRLTLELVTVRYERLQDITTADIFAEGVRIPASPDGHPLLRMDGEVPFRLVSAKHPTQWGVDEFARYEWAHLWDSINGKKAGRAWVDNPWVWALTFKRVDA